MIQVFNKDLKCSFVCLIHFFHRYLLSVASMPEIQSKLLQIDTKATLLELKVTCLPLGFSP